MMSATKKMLLALLALIVSIVYIAVTFRFRRELGWWAFTDCFALFMTVFTWMMSILISRMIPHSGMVLSKIALVFGILFVISLVVEYLVYTIAF
ncbi:MAG: hypothetical protein K2H38_01475 [Muribaculaceae bacterium]|nr:hypothetical protein [Muribaculaceae bacterium]MDE6553945.1 hypothetical protein [Muribaculaceae bacterium]